MSRVLAFLPALVATYAAFGVCRAFTVGLLPDTSGRAAPAQGHLRTSTLAGGAAWEAADETSSHWGLATVAVAAVALGAASQRRWVAGAARGLSARVGASAGRGTRVARKAALMLGQKVKVYADGKPGTIRYMGSVTFAGGEDWVGIELDEPQGMHDGTLFGKTYFESKPKHGVFCKASQLLGGAVPAAAAAPVAAAAPPSPSGAALGLSIGQKVVAHGKPGTIRYMGSVSFATGEDWVGVELDAPTGMHDGTLFGKTYFESKPKHGIFIKASQL